jgi:hypothetical protein
MHQRALAALQVRWQQRQDAPFFEWTVYSLEASPCNGIIQLAVSNIMATRYRTGCAAALEHQLRFEGAGTNIMISKKSNGHKGNAAPVVDQGICAQQRAEATVQSVMGKLVPEQLQRSSAKAPFSNVNNFPGIPVRVHDVCCKVLNLLRSTPPDEIYSLKHIVPGPHHRVQQR